MCSISCIWSPCAKTLKMSSGRPNATRCSARAPTADCAAWPSTAGSPSLPMIATVRTAWCAKSKSNAAGGDIGEVNQYHSYVVAMLIGPVIDLGLAIQPVLNEEARRDYEDDHVGH